MLEVFIKSEDIVHDGWSSSSTNTISTLTREVIGYLFRLHIHIKHTSQSDLISHLIPSTLTKTLSILPYNAIKTGILGQIHVPWQNPHFNHELDLNTHRFYSMPPIRPDFTLNPLNPNQYLIQITLQCRQEWHIKSDSCPTSKLSFQSSARPQYTPVLRHASNQTWFHIKP